MLFYPEVDAARNYLNNEGQDDFGLDCMDFEYFINYDKFQEQQWLMSLVDNSIVEYNALIESEVILVFRLYVSKILTSYVQLVNSKSQNKDVPDNAGYA